MRFNLSAKQQKTAASKALISVFKYFYIAGVILLIIMTSFAMLVYFSATSSKDQQSSEMKITNEASQSSKNILHLSDATSDRKSEVRKKRPQVVNKFIQDNDGCLLQAPRDDYGPHIVAPPEGPMDIVCCNTTKGIMNIAVHSSWAPLGAENFMNMVTSGFFSTRVGLFRALTGFLIQFGLAGDPRVQTEFESSMGGKKGFLVDDPHWLPLGPPGREINGVKRFQKGYMAYAGGGKNSRGTQLIVAFEDNLYLGGGSPWEVPFGQLIGSNSYETLGKIYTGYGEKVSQGKIRNRGNSYLEAEFPNLDYMVSCRVMTKNLPWKYVNRTISR